MPGIRSFVAIDLSDEIRTALADVQEGLKAQSPPKTVRWTRPEAVHLTLQFLGDVAPSQVDAIAGALRRVCANQAPFDFDVKELGVFPNPGRPRVVWVGVAEPSGALVALQQQVTQALAPLGFEPEKRAYSPHLTIGRAARDANRRELALVGDLIARSAVGTLGLVSVDHISLMKSDLQPGGAVYTSLATIPFAKKPGP